MFNLTPKLVAWGVALWLVGSLALRIGGQHMLRPGQWRATLFLFAVSLGVFAWTSRRLCRGARLAESRWPVGAVSLVLPTVLLDPFSCLFFDSVFPNMPSQAAGLFGGWMLCCCAGALLGAVVRR